MRAELYEDLSSWRRTTANRKFYLGEAWSTISIRCSTQSTSVQNHGSRPSLRGKERKLLHLLRSKCRTNLPTVAEPLKPIDSN